MPDKMNLDHLKQLYCEFQKCEVMTMSVVGGQPNKHTNPSYKAIKHIRHTFLISQFILVYSIYFGADTLTISELSKWLNENEHF